MRFLLFSWLLLLSLLSILSYIDRSLAYGQCLHDQKLLLLQLKQNLTFSPLASAALNFSSWDSNADCCYSWDGIQCDVNGHVISVDLNNKSISGIVEGWNSLFELQYLTSLNLAYNNFNSTPIPSGLDRLANLAYLNLSNSGFAGQIPIGIARMKRLVSLDLSTLFAVQPLKLENPDLTILVKDLPELKELNLDGVNISMHGIEWSQAISSALPNLQSLSLSNCYLSGPIDSSFSKLQNLSRLRLDENNITSQVPEFFEDFSNLKVLHLRTCGLIGKFPENIFQLPLLESLDVSGNFHLQGSLPKLPQNGYLRSLILSNTDFSGILPESIGNLKFLSNLELTACRFSGSIPSSMSNLTRLCYIDLSSNNFTGDVPDFGFSENLTQVNLAHNRLTGRRPSTRWGRHNKLVSINLRNNSISGTIPSPLFTLPSLQKLDLSQNQFSGQLREFSNGSSLMLDTLDLSNNMLEGPIPSSIFDVFSLKVFTLSNNKFNGTVWLERFQNLKNLSSLDLSSNNISINSSGTNSALFPQVSTLKFGSCKLRIFPDFLSNQSTLTNLDLSDNQIRGRIPNWIWKIGNGSLLHLNLSNNFLESPDQPLPGDSFKSLAVLDLHSNLIHGPIPILPSSATVLDYSYNSITSIIPTDIGSYLQVAIYFSLSTNSLRGGIPSSICKAQYLQVLDLSNNSLDGSIPPCLGAIIALRVLNLGSNKLNGSMSHTFPGERNLRTLDLSGNNIGGELPKALANCTVLEVLDLGSNQIIGHFPCWLGKLSNLRVLVLRNNKFDGTIPYPQTNNSFQMLQIIDLSSNQFSGSLNSERFLGWTGMMTEEEAESKYKHSILKVRILEFSQFYYQDSITVTSKGQQMEIVKILTIFTSIDLSNNKFEGEIPEAIGKLTSLYVLNLSRNGFTGSIPPSLGNVKQLESLDLSLNKLSGTIPLQLVNLTFLSVFNVSFNQLAGRIPQGSQLQTFDEYSYEGNSGLCGPPLRTNCSDTSPHASPQNNSKATCHFDWQFIFTGLGFGVGAATVFAPLWFWTEGRKWYDQQIKSLLLFMFPTLLYNIFDDGRVDTIIEESLEDEVTDDDHTEERYNSNEGNTDGNGRGRYCVFCTKLDIRSKKVFHDPKCNCHISSQNSSSFL